MKNKLILTDADGVLLDWEWAFSVWMQERGYTLTADNKKSYYLHHHYNELEEKDAKKVIKTFNESAELPEGLAGCALAAGSSDALVIMALVIMIAPAMPADLRLIARCSPMSLRNA